MDPVPVPEWAQYWCGPSTSTTVGPGKAVLAWTQYQYQNGSIVLVLNTGSLVEDMYIDQWIQTIVPPTSSEVPSVAPESPSSPQDLPPDVGPSTNETESWHQLTSYIVGLEKQVQYYKSLVEGMQHAAVASHWQEGAGGSPYAEGLFGHEESESYSPQLPPQALGAHQDEELVEGKGWGPEVR